MTTPSPSLVISEHDRLLLRAAVGRGPLAVAAWDAWISERVLDTIEYPEARLLPQVFDNFNGQDLAQNLPARMRGKYRWVWSNNQLRGQAVAPALRGLADHGIPTMLLKGAALLASGASRWGAREMGDIDVLVPAATAGPAAAVLERHGWHGIADVTADYVARRLVNRRHSWNFTGPPSGTLDLHWHLVDGVGGDHADDLVWDARRATTFGNVTTSRPDDSDQLVHTLEHAAHGEPAHRLLWLVDAAHLLPRADPKRLVAVTRAYGLHDLVADGLDLAAWSLESASAADLARAVRSARRGVREVLRQDISNGAATPRRLIARHDLLQTALAQGMTVQRPLTGTKAMVRRCVEPHCVRRPLVSAPLALLGRPRRLEVAVTRIGGPLSRPPAPRPFPNGTWLDLCSAPMLDIVGGPGWAWPEPDGSGIWADGAEARLVLDVETPRDGDLVLTFLLGTAPRADPPPPVEVWVNGRPLTVWAPAQTASAGPWRVTVPAWLAAWCHPLEVTLRPRRDLAGSPRGAGPGDRRHFLQLRSLRVDTRDATAAAAGTRHVVEAWEHAAKKPDARAVIHPLGVDPIAYERSGDDATAALATLIGDDAELVVVDFGAGDGRVTIPLGRRYRRVIAIDSSETMLERLRSQAPELETVLADGTDPSQLPHDVDAVVALAVLIHHRHRDAARIIAGLTSMLRPGGVLLLDLALYEMSREPEHWTDISVWTRAELDMLAVELQLEVLQAPVSPGQFDGTTLGPQHGQLLMLRRL